MDIFSHIFVENCNDVCLKRPKINGKKILEQENKSLIVNCMMLSLLLVNLCQCKEMHRCRKKLFSLNRDNKMDFDVPRGSMVIAKEKISIRLFLIKIIF